MPLAVVDSGAAHPGAAEAARVIADPAEQPAVADAEFDDREDRGSPAERTEDAVRLGGDPAGERERGAIAKIEPALGAQVHEVALAVETQSRALDALEPSSPVDAGERTIPGRVVR